MMPQVLDISVSQELLNLKQLSLSATSYNMIHIVTSNIEWNSVYLGNKSNPSPLEQITNNKKRCNQDLVNYENRYKKNRKSIKND